MEKLEDILKNWERDAEIDQTEPGKELIKIPLLHNKYLSILTKHKIAVRKSNFDYLRMRKIKWEYYNGKMSQEELMRVTDLYKASLEKKAYHEETVSMVESIMNELKQRTWQLRDFISWEKFIGGQ